MTNGREVSHKESPTGRTGACYVCLAQLRYLREDLGVIALEAAVGLDVRPAHDSLSIDQEVGTPRMEFFLQRSE